MTEVPAAATACIPSVKEARAATASAPESFRQLSGHSHGQHRPHGRRIRRFNEQQSARIGEYLNAVVPGVESVGVRTLGPMETIEFRREVAGDSNPWRFLAANVSDGTLRALGVLVAVFQGADDGVDIPLVAIEEPEIAIHPGRRCG